jgi:NAD(P)-dependent dehydrogenase (short-subunit alcohol dehydrogenase family)
MPPRTVLITGANSGVGYAASKVLASASPPYHVIMAGRSLSKLQAAQSEIHASTPSTHGNLSTVEMDVTSPTSIRAALATISSQHPHLDVLINNAATGNTDPDTYTRYHATLDTNVIGPAVVADTFRPFLLKSPNPYSIYVSSGVGSLSRADEVAQGKREKIPEPANAQAYKASKAALNSIALQEYIEYKDRGLKGILVPSP